MLFKVHSDLAKTTNKDLFFEMNPGALAIEEFGRCSTRQMFFVCLVADRDYDSPLRTLPERTRRERAVVIAGYPLEGDRPDKNARNLINKNVENVEKAISKYRELQYDEDRAMLDAINTQIQETLDAISSDKQEAAKVTKVSSEKKSGNTEKTEYIDAKLLGILRKDATKLSAELPALRTAKAKLLEALKLSSPLEDIIVYSSQDMVTTDETVHSGSTLDIFNEKRFKDKEE
jgi:hypothetical protein